MGLNEILEEMRALSKLKKNWYSVAKIMEKAKSCCAEQANLSRRLSDVYDVSGYSANTVNRMILVKAFYDSVSDTVKDLGGVDPNSLSFPSLEIVKRLYQVNPAEGIATLSAVAKGKITFRELRGIYNQNITEYGSRASVRQMARREMQEFEDAAFRAIKLSSDKLLNDKNKIEYKLVKNYKYPIRVNVVSNYIDDSSNHWVYGFEFLYIRSHKSFRTTFDSLISRIKLNSSFFKALWVVMSSDIGRKCIKDFCGILDHFGSPTIGVAILPSKDGVFDVDALEILRRPVLAESWRSKEGFVVLREFYQRYSRPNHLDESH